MKKIFVLLIVFCISLVSCNIFTETEVRTTITKDEWNASLQSGNYSILSNYMLPIINSGNNFSSGGAEIIKITSDSYSIDYYSKSGTQFDSFFSKRIDGVLYDIEKKGDGYVASKSEVADDSDYPQTESIATWFLSAFNLDWNAVYDCLVYVEDCKAYRGVLGSYVDDEIVAAQVEMECENGKIKKLRLYLADRDMHEPLNGLFTFYDFGTTVVEIPEFTFENQ